jgi:hypothetical protein
MVTQASDRHDFDLTIMSIKSLQSVMVVRVL